MTQLLRILFSVLVVFLIVHQNEAKNFTQCELALELEKHDIPRDEIQNYVCLVENNSLDSEWTGGPYGDGTKNFGLFQINNNDWCVIGRVGGNCTVNCFDLADDDISNDIECAKQVHRLYGFDPWWVWRRECKTCLPDLSHCYTGGKITEEKRKCIPVGGSTSSGVDNDRFDGDFDV